VTTVDDRQPPQNIPAEMAVLGACMQSAGALDDVLEVVGAGHFYRPAHQRIFAEMVAMRDAGQPVDPLTLGRALGRDFFRLGGAPYLLECMQATPASDNATFHAGLVLDCAKQRGVIELGQRTASLGYAVDADVDLMVDRARQDIDRVAEAVGSGSQGIARIEDLSDEAEKRYRSEVPPSLSTGWPDLDQVLAGGLRPKTLTVVGGRPGSGKSMLAGCLATNVALRGVGTMIVSLEMTREELTDRVIANLGPVELTHLVAQTLTDHDFRCVDTARAKLRGTPLDIVDDKTMTLSRIRAKAWARKRSPIGLSLLVVDYLGLVTPADSKQDRQLQVATISRGLKIMADELDVPVVAAHQLNRSSAHRADPRPILTDLRESGGIEQDADVVMLLHRPDPGKDEEVDPTELLVDVAKNRQGPTGVVPLHWFPREARIGSRARFDLIKGGGGEE